MVKNLPSMQETWVQSPSQEDPLEQGMATHSSFLAWRILWTEEPDRLQSTGSQRVGHDWSDSTAAVCLWRPTRSFTTNIQKRCPFHYRGLECKSRSQETPGVTGKLGLGLQNQVGQRLIEFCQEHTGHSKPPLPTTQEKTLQIEITRWPTPKLDWLYSLQSKMEKLFTVSKNKTGSWLWLRSWTPDCQIQT